MGISLKESRSCAEMARLLYDFLPGSGAKSWKGHVTFASIASDVGVGRFWSAGSKEPAIALLLEKTLEYRRDLFEPLILNVVKAGIRYRQKSERPVNEEEIRTLNGLILEVGFKFPALWDQGFLGSLRAEAPVRAAEMVNQELAAERVRLEKQSAKSMRRETLRDTFYTLTTIADRARAGLDLERILNCMFEEAGLAPRQPFRVTGEQIDGSFELDSEIYLVEAKWEAAPLSEQPLLVFRGKVEGKSQFTRGIFVAINGFTEQGQDAITRGKQPNFFLMDGYDVAIVLEGRLSLVEMLRAKLRLLAEEGKVFVSARQLI